MEITGFALGVLIGVSLGLIGSGGSILTIPVLVYVMHIAPGIATTYSLFIVGVAALAGSIKSAKDRLLNYTMALYFGLPSIVSVFIMRKYVVPILPATLFTISGFTVTKNNFIMLVFAVLMIAASFSMISKSPQTTIQNEPADKNKIVFKGIFIGLLTGFVGVGGGFLIIPTLLFSAKLPMKKAVGTSLIIIAFNSLIGFAGSLANQVIDWKFLLLFTAFAVAGIIAGMMISNKISNEKLKPAFGWFVFVTGVYVIFRELFFK